MSLQSEVIEAFSLTSICLDVSLNIHNNYCDGLMSQIYLSELQLNKANPSETETPFLDLHLSILDGCGDFDLENVNSPYLDGDVPLRASYGVYIS